MEWNKLKFLLIALALFPIIAGAQVGPNSYIVFFTDKENTPYSISEPSAYLSERAIQRRSNQGIAIDSLDLPVDPEYIQAVKNLGDVEILHTLKWMNAILIKTTDPDVLFGVSDLIGFDRLEVSRSFTAYDNLTFKKPTLAKDDADYGPSLNQIEMLNGLQLHADGYRGEGMLIAVLDGGFSLATSAGALDSLFDENRVLAQYNFVDNSSDVFQHSTHGSYVLSSMASIMKDSIIGTAPKASYLLAVTEDVSQERRIEEAHWEAAAEYADSAGADIINTSLGYHSFDVIEDGYSYSDMDGNTTLITRASDIAATRGMLLVTSAGNSGDDDWYYIGAPGDGFNVLAIGAVNAEGLVTNFSSRGPSFDGRVKPNVMAQGRNTVVSDLGDGIATTNGTSLSSPVLAGMAACLWQANPGATAMQVFDAIEMSASLFEMPNDSMGYGIPDFEIARQLLQNVVSVESPLSPKGKNEMSFYPNPFQGGRVSISIPKLSAGTFQAVIINVEGKMIYRNSALSSLSDLEQNAERAFLSAQSGVYVALVRDAEGQVFTAKVLLP